MDLSWPTDIRVTEVELRLDLGNGEGGETKVVPSKFVLIGSLNPNKDLVSGELVNISWFLVAKGKSCPSRFK